MTGRVLLVADFGSTGGTRTFLEELLPFYREMSWNVDLVPMDSHVDARLRGTCEALGVDILPTIRGRSAGGATGRSLYRAWGERANLRSMRADFEALADARGSTHVVVTTGTPGAHLAALTPNRASLYILHTYPHGARQRLIGNRLIGPAIPRNAVIVAVSEYQRSLVRRMWCSRVDRNIALVRNVPPARVASASSASGRNPVVTIGALEAYKEPNVWLEAAAAWRQVRPNRSLSSSDSAEWVWVGSGSLEQQMRSRVAERGLHDVARFTGEVVDPSPFLAKARVYVQTSSVENMSFSVLEAMSVGIPCVVTDAGALPEIIENDTAGIVVPQGDPVAVASAVSRLLQDDDLYERLAAGARAAIADRHQPDLWRTSMRRVHGVEL